MSNRTFTRKSGFKRNGGSSKGSKKAKKVWKNIADYPCQSQETAYYSSRLIARHITAECGCDPDKRFRCKAMKRYEGQDYDNWGSKAKVIIPLAITPERYR